MPTDPRPTVPRPATLLLTVIYLTISIMMIARVVSHRLTQTDPWDLGWWEAIGLAGGISFIAAALIHLILRATRG